MQTAIEWLISVFAHNDILDHKALSSNERLYNLYKRLVKQAKEMEKQQIIDAYWGGLNGSINDYSIAKEVGSEIIDIRYGKGADQYYNETYGSKGSDDQVPDVRKMVEDDNYLTPVDWLMDRIKWINRETYDYLIKEGQYDRAKRMESSTSSQTEISEPNPQLIESMCYRYRHDFGLLEDNEKESIKITMKQLWEEVVGKGFYKPKEISDEEIVKAFTIETPRQITIYHGEIAGAKWYREQLKKKQ